MLITCRCESWLVYTYHTFQTFLGHAQYKFVNNFHHAKVWQAATSRQHVKIKMAEKVEGEEPTIATDLVVTKYKMAAEMVNGVYLKNLL